MSISLTLCLNTSHYSALKHYRGAESDCKTAKELNAKASTNADIADELHEQIVGSVHKLQGLVEKLRELVTKEDGISEKVKKINRKITAIQGNERNSTVLHEQANEKYNEVKAEYDAEKEKPTFDMGRQFTEKVEDLRKTQNKAFRLQDNVKALMEEVKNYKKEWEDLQKRHREIKAQVDDKKVIYIINLIQFTLIFRISSMKLKMRRKRQETQSTRNSTRPRRARVLVTTERNCNQLYDWI